MERRERARVGVEIRGAEGMAVQDKGGSGRGTRVSGVWGDAVWVRWRESVGVVGHGDRRQFGCKHTYPKFRLNSHEIY